jgi:hypothetical protein
MDNMVSIFTTSFIKGMGKTSGALFILGIIYFIDRKINEKNANVTSNAGNATDATKKEKYIENVVNFYKNTPIPFENIYKDESFNEKKILNEMENKNTSVILNEMENLNDTENLNEMGSIHMVNADGEQYTVGENDMNQLLNSVDDKYKKLFNKLF